MSDSPLLTWKGRRVRSPSDGPEAAARKVPESIRPGSLFFVPSPLEGWGLETLLQRLPTDGAVVWLEKDPALRTATEGAWKQHLGPLASHPQLFRLEGDNEASVRHLMRRLPLNRLRRCELLTFSGAWLADGARYREVFARLERGLSTHWANRITTVHMGPLWLRNLFDNLRSQAGPFLPWPDWSNDPVLVCGAGLSLQSALPWAREHRKQIRLLAADTALPVLRDWGLIPDAVVCLEAQHANLRDFAGWRGADVTLFADLTSFPPGARVFSAPPRWFVSEFSALSLWDRWPWDAEVPRLPPLGSVGVAAAWVAWRLTQGPVVFAGLDFSYPPGQTHARGAPALAGLASSTTRLRPMEQPGSWAGGPTRPAQGNWMTTPVLEAYAGVLRDQAVPHAARTWAWSAEGLDLGVSTGRPPIPVRTGAVRETAASPHTLTPSGWLADERLRWSTLLNAFETLNQTRGANISAVEEALRGLDYLTFSFPDPDFRPDSDWLSRALAQVTWLWKRQTPKP